MLVGMFEVLSVKQAAASLHVFRGKCCLYRDTYCSTVPDARLLSFYCFCRGSHLTALVKETVQRANQRQRRASRSGAAITAVQEKVHDVQTHESAQLVPACSDSVASLLYVAAQRMPLDVAAMPPSGAIPLSDTHARTQSLNEGKSELSHDILASRTPIAVRLLMGLRDDPGYVVEESAKGKGLRCPEVKTATLG